MKHMQPYRLAACSLLVAACGVLLLSCGPKTVPVSTTGHKTSTTDSSRVVTNTHTDSSYYRETVTEKTLKGATVGITLSPAQLDSLVRSLATLPTAVARTVYYQDPQSKAQLKILLDSMNRIRFECAALDQKYFEKSTQQGRYIEKLQTELVEKNKIINEQSHRISQLQQSKWKLFWQKLGWKLWWFWLLVGLSAATLLYSKALPLFQIIISKIFKS